MANEILKESKIGYAPLKRSCKINKRLMFILAITCDKYIIVI